MGPTSYSEYLCSLDDSALAALLVERPDGRAEPLPGSVARLADRLASPASLGAALPRLDRDALEVVRAVGVLGDQATPAFVASLLGAPEPPVAAALDTLSARALVWPRGESGLRLPDRLREHVHAELGADGRIDRLARHVGVDALRSLARAHGVTTDGLRKPELVEALLGRFGDVHGLVDRVTSLPEPQFLRLRQALTTGVVEEQPFGRRSPDRVVDGLRAAGMIVETQRGGDAIPDEVSVAFWLAGVRVKGPPDLPAAGPGDTAGAAAAAAASVRLVVTLLERVATAPVPALKRGGVGKREQARLVKALGLDDERELALAIDLAEGAGLLGLGPAGYTTTDAFGPWRESGPTQRWAVLVTAWWGLAQPSTWRVDPEGADVAPPLDTVAPSTATRRAVLELAMPDRSVHAVADVLDWHRPFDPEPPDRRAAIAAATIDEATRLGLVTGDALSPLGVALVLDRETLAATAAEHLVHEPGRVLLASDLTAVVSGELDGSLVRLLDAAADVESRGAATTYRFSPSSVRRALDGGWCGEAILDALRAVAERELPQPLEYLVADAARKHGSVRVHETRTCVVVDEALGDELAAARALRTLRWRRHAPTVLATHSDPAQVLAMLRGAGYSPVLDDGAGSVVVEGAASATAPSSTTFAERVLATPQDAVARLRAGVDDAPTPTMVELGAQNPRLDDAELELLAHAVDAGTAVHLTYRNNAGHVTGRVVTPRGLHHRWIQGWCHLREDERAFTVSSILGVAPP